jgi:hypothetical protein
MNKVVGVGIAVVGGYFLLKAMGIDLLGTAAPATTTGVATTPQAATPTSTASNTLITAILAKIVADGQDPNAYHSVDWWNVYYQLTKGVPGPAPEALFPGVDRNNTYTYAQYASGLAAQGLSGLGVIAHHVNPYTNVQGTPFGSNLVPNGFEKFIVVKGA